MFFIHSFMLFEKLRKKRDRFFLAITRIIIDLE
jgi:hypothetical protein